MENIRGNEVFLNTERKPSSRSYFLDGVAGVANSGELAGSKMAGGNEVLCPDKTQWPLKYEEAARLIKIYIYRWKNKSNATTERKTDSDKIV